MLDGLLGAFCGSAFLEERESARKAETAGRESAVMRAFLQAHGAELKNAAYVLTRSSGAQYQEVFRQMDRDVPAGHRAAVSLRSGDVGWAFWQEEFLRQVRAFLAEG